MADRRLQVFYTVAKQLSFTKAADQLFMTQPAVTFQVKQLEEQFNTRLFERSHGRIALTPAGRLGSSRVISLYGTTLSMRSHWCHQPTGKLSSTPLVSSDRSDQRDKGSFPSSECDEYILIRYTKT